MKYLLTILILSLYLTVLSQKNNYDSTNTLYKSIAELSIVDSIDSWEIRNKLYKKPYYSEVGSLIKFDSSDNYYIRAFSCLGGDILETGKWEIKGDKLYLISDKKKSVYNYIKFEKYRFLVNTKEARNFISIFFAAKKEAVTRGIDSSRFIFYKLEENYFCAKRNSSFKDTLE